MCGVRNNMDVKGREESIRICKHDLIKSTHKVIKYNNLLLKLSR